MSQNPLRFYVVSGLFAIAPFCLGCGDMPVENTPQPVVDAGMDVEACMPACALGAMRCQDAGFQSCVVGPSGCAEWGEVTGCTAPKVCLDGACVQPCVDACIKDATRCGSGGVENCVMQATGCTDWASAVPCEPPTVCSGGACVAQCSDQCSVGTTQCSGASIQTCSMQANGCTDWDTPLSCGANMGCSGGVCVSLCTNQCATGTTQCSGASIQKCSVQANGCTDWDTPLSCGPMMTCANGSCVCVNQCVLGTAQCSGASIQTCSMQANGCADWDMPVSCGANMGCSGGVCVSLCTNQCAMGTTQCSGASIQTCSLQANGCTDWDMPVSCGPMKTCANGACVCANQCVLGATQCSGTSIQTCSLQANGCTDWDTPVSCGPMKTCANGACMCMGGCNLGDTQCSNGGQQTCVMSPTQCTEWSNVTSCNLLEVCDTVVGACVADPLPPRFIAPLAGALVSGGVVFQWETDPTATESVVEVCSDKMCGNVVESFIHPTGATVSMPLPRGAYFVRGRGRRIRPDMTYLEGSKWSTPRSIFVTGRPVTSPALLGMMPDLDGDGIPERIIGNTFPPSSAGADISILWGTGTSTIISGGWVNNGIREAAFAATMQNGSDIDGNGWPEIIMIQQLKSQAGGSWVETDPFRVLRYGLNKQGVFGQLQLQNHVDIPKPFHSLVAAGDINGDGYADVLVSRRLYVALGETGIQMFVVLGGKDGFSTPIPMQIDIPLALRTSSTQVTVRGVGDVDGDGFADVAIGIDMLPDACQDPPSGPIPGNRGYVDIMRGAATNPLSQALARIDGIGSVAPMGDINGDGRADLGAVVKARIYMKALTPGNNCAGYSLQYVPGALNVYYGATAGPFAMASWTLPTHTSTTCTNQWNYTKVWQIAGTLAGGGDLDGDTFGDFALASPTLFDPGGGNCPAFPGQVYVFYGNAGGTISPPAQTIIGPDGDDRQFGRSAAIVGNVFGTGSDEILIGQAYWRNATQTSATRATVRLFSGPTGALSVAQTYISGASLFSNDSFGIRLMGGL